MNFLIRNITWCILATLILGISPACLLANPEIPGAPQEKPIPSSSSSASSSPHHHTRDSTKLPPDWNKYNDKEGRRYYSNNSTHESAWVAPEGSTGGSTNK